MRLFHGKFIRFMSGLRNTGQVINQMSEKGYYDPSTSKINFAVLSQTTLHKHLSQKPPFFPGINKGVLDDISAFYEEVPAVDAKKISRGKGKAMGDINCWGIEDSPTLQERMDRLENEKDFVDEILTVSDKLENSKVQHLCDLPTQSKEEVHRKLKELMRLLGMRNEELRKTEVTLSRSEEKFRKLGGDNWRSSKYFPVISLMRVRRSEVRKQIDQSLTLSDSIAEVGSTLASTRSNVRDGSFDLSNHSNYHPLNDNCKTTDTRYIQQRTQEWHALRNEAKLILLWA